MKLQPAVLADASRILALQEAARSRTYQPMTLSSIEKAIRQDVVFLVVFGACIVGALIYKRGDPVILDEFVISSAFRGKGIGTAALEAILQEVNGIPVELITHPENPAACLYEKHGFTKIADLPNYYGDGEPRMRMRREA